MKNLLFIIAFTAIFYSCDSDDAPSQESLLPPITMTGENTFGCLIDGKFFKPRDGRITVNSDNKGLRIITTESTNVEYKIDDFKSNKTSSLLIHIENFRYNSSEIYLMQDSNGLSSLDGLNNTYAHCRIWKNDQLGYQRYITFPNSGQIEISNQINTGVTNFHNATFDMKLINTQNVNDTINIVLGRFDLEAFTLQNTSFN